MKKLYYLIVLTLILGLVLTGCLLSNVGQVPTSEQSGITNLTRGVPLSADLIGLWRFNGDAKDSSGNGLGGALSSSGASFVVDGFGQALNVDGTGWVQVPDSSLLEPSEEITVEAWVKRLGTPGSCKYVVSKYLPDHHGGYSSYGLYSGGSGGIRFYIGYTSGVILSPAVAQATIWDGEWHHVAGTFDGSEVKLYFDKVPVGGASTIQDIYYYDGISDLFIGSYYNGPWLAFSGRIDEVRIWNCALSQGELDSVIYEWDGFFPPVDNEMLNVVKAGRAIPIKFSLNGDQGLEIFAADYPKSKKIACPAGEPVTLDEIATVTAAGGSGLSYDDTDGQYTYVWKTNKAWTGCRQLIVKLIDGTSHVANFKFK